MTPTSIPSPLPLQPLLPGLRRIFGDPRFCTDGEVLALAFPSESTLCSVEESGLLRVWDVATGSLRSWRFLSKREALWQFTQDGRYLASGGRELGLWDVRSGQLLQVYKQPAWVTALAFRGDGSAASEDLILATGDESGQIYVWSKGGEQLLRPLLGHAQAVSTLAFSPDGTRLASAGEDKFVCIWDLLTGRCLATLTGHTDRVTALSWHPRGQFLASAGWEGNVAIWDTTTGELAHQLDHPPISVQALAFDARGERLATVDAARAVRFWMGSARTLYRTLPAESTSLAWLTFSPTGDLLAAAGSHRRIELFSLAGDHTAPVSQPVPAPTALSGFRRNWNSLALGPREGLLAEIGTPAQVRVWEGESLGRCLEVAPPACFQAVALSPDGRWLAAGAEDGQVYLWDVAAGTLVATLDNEEQQGPLTSLVFAPDSSWLAGASAARMSCCRWQLPEGETAWFLADALDGCTIEALAVSADGQYLAAAGIDWLATGGSDGLALVWHLSDWQEVAAFEQGCTNLAFHPAGHEVALALLNGTIQLWAIGAAQPRLSLTGPQGIVTALAFTADGCLLATGGDDRLLRLWKVADGELLAQVELDSQTKTLAFSPDGRHLFTANGNAGSYQFEVARLLKGDG